MESRQTAMVGAASTRRTRSKAATVAGWNHGIHSPSIRPRAAVASSSSCTASGDGTRRASRCNARASCADCRPVPRVPLRGRASTGRPRCTWPGPSGSGASNGRPTGTPSPRGGSGTPPAAGREAGTAALGGLVRNGRLVARQSAPFRAHPVCAQPDGVGELLPVQGRRRPIRPCGRPVVGDPRTRAAFVGIRCALPGKAGHSAALREIAEQHFHELTSLPVGLETTRGRQLDRIQQLVEGVRAPTPDPLYELADQCVGLGERIARWLSTMASNCSRVGDRISSGRQRLRKAAGNSRSRCW